MGLHCSLVVYGAPADSLLRLFRDLSSQRDAFDKLHILVSGSNDDYGRVTEMLNDTELVDQSEVVHRYDNLGFASGHNMLLRQAFDQEAHMVLLLNPDLTLTAGSLARFSNVVSEDNARALYGPSLERADVLDGVARTGVGRANVVRTADSLGIDWSLDGRHFDVAQGEPWDVSEGVLREVRGLTGASLLVKRDVFDEIVATSGWFWDDVFLAYREDAELAVRSGAMGIGSRLVELDGFGHIRSVRGYVRGRELPDLLGVRNRFILRGRLGRLRPGNRFLAGLRDCVVVIGVLTMERRSVPGLKSAFAIRRFVKYGAYGRQ